MISPETLTRLTEYLEYIHKNTPDLLVKKPVTETENILGVLTCITEEVGELAAEVRKYTKYSFSQKKCDSFEMWNLEEELADVLITTFLLAKAVGIESFDPIINRKIGKNRERGY